MINSLAALLLNGNRAGSNMPPQSLTQVLGSDAPPGIQPMTGTYGNSPLPGFRLLPWSANPNSRSTPAVPSNPIGIPDPSGKLTLVPPTIKGLQGPAYKTNNGAIIQLNKPPPTTILPTGSGLDHLISFADNSGLKSVCVSGGQETVNSQGNPAHYGSSFHYPPNRAVDICEPNEQRGINVGLDDDSVRKAAVAAGYTHGVFEIHPSPSGNGPDVRHWHLQVGAGNGLGDEHDLSKHPMQTKVYPYSKPTIAGQQGGLP